MVTAYLLTSTVVTPIYGKLSDIHGRRLMLLIAIGIFLAGSVACALSRDIYVLIAARAFQGLGGGALISLGQTIVGDIIPPRERGRYQAYFAAIFVTSSIAGPVLGGFFAEYLHWSYIFWINLPLGLAAYLMTNRVLKLLPRHDRPHRIDILGAASHGRRHRRAPPRAHLGRHHLSPGTRPLILGLLAASLVGWVLFAWRLASAPEPFIPLSVLANPVVRNGVISPLFAVGTLVGLSVFVPLYFEAVLGLTAAESGFALIAFMGGTVAGARPRGRIMVHFEHYKRAAVIGLALATVTHARLRAMAGHASPSSPSRSCSRWSASASGRSSRSPPPRSRTPCRMHQIGTVTGVLNFFRSLGGALLVAGFGAIFLAAAATGSETASVQTVILEGTRNGTDFARCLPAASSSPRRSPAPSPSSSWSR